ncbi:MAG: MotA/TolQ/ExbB proton channel family protein [bacterium]|nr:MotA/TolQ/ExbB proton channel family protein [bacterium]
MGAQFATYFERGGPVMYAVLAIWVIVFAAMLERGTYAIARALRRPGAAIAALVAEGRVDGARRRLTAERARATHGLARIDAVSQLATSVGLFGTVLGLARSFLVRGSELSLAAPEVLASGLATALYTTIAGLLVFLTGQSFLIAYREWEGLLHHELEQRVERSSA